MDSIWRAVLTQANWTSLLFMCLGGNLGLSGSKAFAEEAKLEVATVLERVRDHDFHPLNSEGTFTIDRHLKQHGIANLDNRDWRVRLLALRDLTRLLPEEEDAVAEGMLDDNVHVRQIAAASLGIIGKSTRISQLESLLENDGSPLVRSQAAMSLGQLESRESLKPLRNQLEQDPSRDVRHQCELAIDQIKKKMGATTAQLEAFRSLDETSFETVKVGQPAPDFELDDTKGNPWKLSEVEDGRWVVLIWIFADWCPVCHGEFRDLIEMQDEFRRENVELVTIECHDTYRGRVMLGKEIEPKYWFADQSFQQLYVDNIRWPHLLDRAGAVGATYGVDPMSFAVHAEYINRPSTIIIDPEGTVQLAYYGTYWGDRPSIRQTLEMIKQQDFEFEHPKRLKSNEKSH